MAKVFKVSAIPLTVSEVLGHLKDPPAEQINSIPPAEPKGGEIYLFHGARGIYLAIILAIACRVILGQYSTADSGLSIFS